MCFSMGWIANSSSFANQICLLLALANLLYCGKQFYVSAWKQLLHHTANMDSLVALNPMMGGMAGGMNGAAVPPAQSGAGASSEA